jgi:hypothetical protein
MQSDTLYPLTSPNARPPCATTPTCASARSPRRPLSLPLLWGAGTSTAPRKATSR